MIFKKLVEQTFDVKYLQVVVPIRHPEDAMVDGVEDIEGKLLPWVSGKCWCPTILIETGQILNWPEETTADILFKVVDEGRYVLFDTYWSEIEVREDYVPDIMCPGGEGYGDYIIMSIDENGFIKNWNPDLSDWKKEEE